VKIIGIASDNKWICEIGQDEVARVFNNYSMYLCSDEKLSKARIGDEIKLDTGFVFKEEIRELCSEIKDFQESFEKSQNSLFQFTQLISNCKTIKEPQ
jgi:hypothetical protein